MMPETFKEVVFNTIELTEDEVKSWKEDELKDKKQFGLFGHESLEKNFNTKLNKAIKKYTIIEGIEFEALDILGEIYLVLNREFSFYKGSQNRIDLLCLNKDKEAYIFDYKFCNKNVIDEIIKEKENHPFVRKLEQYAYDLFITDVYVASIANIFFYLDDTKNQIICSYIIYHTSKEDNVVDYYRRSVNYIQEGQVFPPIVNIRTVLKDMSFAKNGLTDNSFDKIVIADRFKSIYKRSLSSRINELKLSDALKNEILNNFENYAYNININKFITYNNYIVLPALKRSTMNMQAEFRNTYICEKNKRDTIEIDRRLFYFTKEYDRVFSDIRNNVLKSKDIQESVKFYNNLTIKLKDNILWKIVTLLIYKYSVKSLENNDLYEYLKNIIKDNNIVSEDDFKELFGESYINFSNKLSSIMKVKLNDERPYTMYDGKISIHQKLYDYYVYHYVEDRTSSVVEDIKKYIENYCIIKNPNKFFASEFCKKNEDINVVKRIDDSKEYKRAVSEISDLNTKQRKLLEEKNTLIKTLEEKERVLKENDRNIGILQNKVELLSKLIISKDKEIKKEQSESEAKDEIINVLKENLKSIADSVSTFLGGVETR